MDKAQTRFALVLIAIGAIAVLLAAVGLNGVLSDAVRQRAAEISLVVGQGLRVSAIGIAAGIAAAFYLTTALHLHIRHWRHLAQKAGIHG